MLQIQNKDIREVCDSALNMVYPRRCPVCDEIISPFEFRNGRFIVNSLIHPACSRKIKRITGATCLKCGKKLLPSEKDNEYCRDCRKIRHFFVKGFSLFEYRSVAGSIYRFKYLGRQEYADFYAKEAAGKYGRKLKNMGVDAIIPVPMYGPKEKQRGYNQAQVLAERISLETSIPVYKNVIKRCKNTLPMKKLDARGRRSNLKKAFIITRNDVKFNCILIIDDIYTTGSTIDEIAHEFLMAGVKEIYFLTLAIGQTS